MSPRCRGGGPGLSRGHRVLPRWEARSVDRRAAANGAATAGRCGSRSASDSARAVRDETWGRPYAAATSTFDVGVKRSLGIVDVRIGLGLLTQSAVNQSLFSCARISVRGSSDVRELVNQGA